jgi:SAM-dependent methyltransferase
MSPDAPGTPAGHLALGRTVGPYATLAPVYDALLGDRFFSQLRHTFAWLVGHYGLQFGSAADVACGTGTFVAYLRRRGVPLIYGVDRSPEMLQVAIARNRATGARFLRQDFRSLRLPRPVDLLTCNFDSLNYLLTAADLLSALRRFRANLKPGGHAVFDMITDRLPWQDRGPRVERAAQPGVTVTRLTRRDPRRGLQVAVVSISRNGRSRREIHVQRGYPILLVARLLAQAGLTLRGVHDFHTLGPATSRSRRVVYVALKAGTPGGTTDAHRWTPMGTDGLNR